jgi:hypothetical protein
VVPSCSRLSCPPTCILLAKTKVEFTLQVFVVTLLVLSRGYLLTSASIEIFAAVLRGCYPEVETTLKLSLELIVGHSLREPKDDVHTHYPLGNLLR